MSDYETRQRKQNLAVGIFVIVAVFALGWLIFKFGDLPVTVSRFRSFKVFVQFSSAPGVQKDTPVRFCGYQIGRVTDVMAPRVLKDSSTGLNYHQTKVILSIDKKYSNIPSNVAVKLMTRGLGSSYIELKLDPTVPLKRLDPNVAGTEYLVDGILLQGSTGVTSEFFPEESQKKLDELVDGFVTVVGNMNDILGDRTNKENLKITLANLTKATERATTALKEIENLSVAGKTMLNNADAQITNVAEVVLIAGEELSKTTAELRIILEKINDGEGTASRFLNDGKLYENFLENTHQLQMLLKELEPVIKKLKEDGIKLL
ncbi:MlaD family protein [Planctomycetota bacterium]